jgi:acyl-coenzyme A synthetase/AMP-(fatty) acid ligase
VVVSNRATANVIARTLEAWKVTQRDVFISVTPLHHDMAVFDVFGCLTAGATLVMPTQAEERDAIRWNQLVEQHRVSLWCSVPAILEMLLACRRGDELTTLRLIAQGGDYIKAGTIAELRRLLPNARLFSLGGPTETTIWSIWHELGLQDVEVIPYGRPVPPNRYFVLNDRGEHCPSGVVGRIHTAGVNVALGYLEAGVLVQHDFVTIDDEEGKPVRAFRSGDYGRYRPDGTLIFAGRVQGYVKVRGVRVSLAAIERELGAHEAILQALAVDFGVEHAGESAIGLLYVRHASRSPSHAELREFVRARLPESHVPARFVEVDALPLSRNGKPDRARAREILALRSEPNDRASQRLLAIYLSVLGGPPTTKVDDSTDFATLGLLPSHLKTIAARIHEELGVRLSPRQLLHCRNAQQVKLLCGA